MKTFFSTLDPLLWRLALFALISPFGSVLVVALAKIGGNVHPLAATNWLFVAVTLSTLSGVVIVVGGLVFRLLRLGRSPNEQSCTPLASPQEISTPRAP